VTMEAHDQPTRRAFLDTVIAAGSAVTVAGLTVPGVLYLWPAAQGGAGDEVEVKDAGSLQPGQSTMVQIKGKAVIVIRETSGYRAMSAICTHLGCLVKWESTKKEFLCPCHAAVFDRDGAVVSGPAPAPLPAYKVKDVAGKVYVSAA